MTIEMERPWKLIECPACWSRLRVTAEDIYTEEVPRKYKPPKTVKRLTCPVCVFDIKDPIKHEIRGK